VLLRPLTSHTIFKLDRGHSRNESV
jgi:hypothetical protein